MTAEPPTRLPDDCADYHGEPLYETVELIGRNLLNPPALRAIASIVGGSVLLLSERSFDLVPLSLGSFS